MQLVRVLEPRPRTYTSKVIEVWRAMQLELRLSKTEILEHYLSYISFGRNIEGVEAASLAYFGHLPNRLEADEIAIKSIERRLRHFQVLREIRGLSVRPSEFRPFDV